VDVNRRFGGGFQVRGVYTFSKSLDDGTAWNSGVGANAPGFVMYPGNPELDWGPSTTDVRHLAAINGVWELPYGRKGHSWAQKIFGGWKRSTIETLQNGSPFTAQLGFNPTNNGDSRNPIRPSVNPAIHGPVILGGPNRYFDAHAFLPPASGTYGNVGRDTLTGPGMATLDAALRKTAALTEKTRLELAGRGLQHFQSGEFRDAECGGVHVGRGNSGVGGGRHHVDRDKLAAGAVGGEGAVVRRRPSAAGHAGGKTADVTAGAIATRHKSGT
jgi:hypothetical protein